ncbi:hypothetical protein HNY73_004281 [Argiope bruennichi]|uniref:Uncharacterized protein n=1 Tax=Argiope bruennichi TaxID=94029 RepID=A0A8T0FQ51_ARGBR|nr:hypothetical protein HNY73_004281 [Argiope bruennichi]
MHCSVRPRVLKKASQPTREMDHEEEKERGMKKNRTRSFLQHLLQKKGPRFRMQYIKETAGGSMSRGGQLNKTRTRLSWSSEKSLRLGKSVREKGWSFP